MASFPKVEYTYDPYYYNNDYTSQWTTSGTSVYSPQYGYAVAAPVVTAWTPAVSTPLEPVVKTGEEGWLDEQINEVMSLGRAEPVLA